MTDIKPIDIVELPVIQGNGGACCAPAPAGEAGTDTAASCCG